PGQHETHDFPVLSTGPTPQVDRSTWALNITDLEGSVTRWNWPDLMRAPSEDFTVDIHCVTKWSRLDTTWRGVRVNALLGKLADEAEYALIRCYGGYTTNLPMGDLVDRDAWIAYKYEGTDLKPPHGGPARLVVPHLYLWKSAKWINGIELRRDDQPGFWETHGYHAYGDPWLEQRYAGD
ncbi:molybdopterin-dependent oxidoreductase, partial [Streptomyces sp. NPDC002130]